MKIIHRKTDWLIGIIIWSGYCLLLFGSIYLRYLDNLLWVVSPLLFAIPTLIATLFFYFNIDLLGKAFFIIVLFLNSYAVAVMVNKLRFEKSHFYRWLKYSFGYIVINIFISLFVWYLFILPALENFLKVFFGIIGK